MEPIGITDEMLQCAYHHGANVARVAVALQSKDLMARESGTVTRANCPIFRLSITVN